MKIFGKLLTLLVTSFAFFLLTTNVRAEFAYSIDPAIPKENTGGVNVRITGLNANATYEICSMNTNANCRSGDAFDYWDLKTDGSGTLNFTICAKNSSQIKIGCNENNDYWHFGKYSMKISGRTGAEGFTQKKIEFTIEHFYPSIDIKIPLGPTEFIPSKNPKSTSEIILEIGGSRRLFHDRDRNDYKLILEKSGSEVTTKTIDVINNETHNISFGALAEGSYLMHIKENGGSEFSYYLIAIEVENDADGGSINIVADPTDKDKSVGGGKSGRFPGQNPCTDGKKCVTALGEIQTNPLAFTTRILTIALGFAGGVALIIMVVGSIKIILSSGDQQKLQNGREMIIAGIAGLLFIIFSVIILRVLQNQIVSPNTFI